jgi:aquaporin Z
MSRKLLAEAFGTFWLVFGGCGSAVLAAGVPDVGIGWVGVSLAFGLTVLTMAYAVGGISGGHFNPAVSLGLLVAGRFERGLLLPYWAAQVAGAILAAAVLYVVVSGQPEFAGVGGFASNGYGAASPGGYALPAALVTEILMTAGFVVIILGATARNAVPGFAPIAIGLALTLIHLVSIPVTNTSVNPARSTGVALFADAPALTQLWLFWVAPLIGGVAGALIWRAIEPSDVLREPAPAVARPTTEDA